VARERSKKMKLEAEIKLPRVEKPIVERRGERGI
jgi:hypothetical protein